MAIKSHFTVGFSPSLKNPDEENNFVPKKLLLKTYLIALSLICQYFDKSL